MATKVTNLSQVKIDDQAMRCMPGASFNPGGMTREAKSADGRADFYAETPTPAECSFTLLHASDTDLIGIGEKVDATVSLITDTGPVYVMENAYCAEPPVLGAGGEVTCVFRSGPAKDG